MVATAPLIIKGFAEGLWQARHTKWFSWVTVDARMEKVLMFCLSCPIKIQWGDPGNKGAEGS